MDDPVKTLEISRRTIGDQVNLCLAIARAGHFNRDSTTEHFRAVVEARWKVIESVVFAEIARLERIERGEDPVTRLSIALRAACQALEGAREQFAFYVESHKQKHTPEGNEKAGINQRFVDSLDQVIGGVQAALESFGNG